MVVDELSVPKMSQDPGRRAMDRSGLGGAGGRSRPICQTAGSHLTPSRFLDLGACGARDIGLLARPRRSTLAPNHRRNSAGRASERDEPQRRARKKHEPVSDSVLAAKRSEFGVVSNV